MVKITTRALKIGVQSRFNPISTVGFRTFFPENFGQPGLLCTITVSKGLLQSCCFLEACIVNESLALQITGSLQNQTLIAVRPSVLFFI